MLPRQTKNDAASDRSERQTDSPVAVPTLRLLCNENVEQELPLDRPRILIGRSEDNDLCIPSRYISRHHILLVRHDNSTILIDLESTNGTFVNSERVYNHVLADGDEISIDQQSLFVHYSIEYRDPMATRQSASDGTKSQASAIKKALAEIRSLLGSGDTDILPTLREDVPTAVHIIDDR